MQQLTDGCLLYHGSYTETKQINLGLCYGGLDFGKGFYLTSSYQQAKDYIPASIRKNIRRNVLPPDFNVSDGRISVFRFHKSDNIKIHCFDTANSDWLHYVSANRNSSLFPDLLQEFSAYDIIGGKIANDNTALTLNAYIAGTYGTPGTKRTDDFVIGSLFPERLTDQFCFRTERAILSLEFVRSDRYGDSSRKGF